jgi:acetyl-CoA synthetase
VGPAEIESVLVDKEKVSEAAVIGVPDEAKGQALIAFCVAVAAGAGTELEKELQQRVSDQLGKPLRPARVLFVVPIKLLRKKNIYILH